LRVAEDANSFLSLEKSPKEKVVKEKPAKRKASEALDLSQKSSKTRRMKASPAGRSKPSADGTDEMNKSGPNAQSNKVKPAKQKKTRTSSKKVSTTLQQAVGPKEDEAGSVIGPALEDSVQPENPTQTANTEPTSSPVQMSSSTEGPLPPEPDETLSASPPRSRAAPTFIKPMSPPPLVLPSQRSKPADPEDDEGIHSSHEGGSDISDSASEGSDDSGLNGNAAGSAKMANDPETPTDEIPTPTELKSHMCIFCDRTFPLEAEYRRHLNRHLVNVYYMDSAGKAQK